MVRSRALAGPAWPYSLLLLLWFAGTIGIFWQVAAALRQAILLGQSPILQSIAWGLVGAGESIAWFYLLGFLAKSATYLWLPKPSTHPARPKLSRRRRVAVLYLTAGDFDAAALDSLLRLRFDAPGLLIVHDDGDDPEARSEIAAFLSGHPNRSDWDVAVWHRTHRVGGKAGAVNWVLERLDPRWELLLLCDSDSIALDPDAVLRSEGEFEDPRVAVVQFRNVGYSGADEPSFQRRLACAINVFDVFASAQSAWGYVPFFGHNALLRIEDLRRAGCLTPGFFSDDLDLSARLTLAGNRIVYRRDVVFGERHPTDFESFRKRSRKWSLGCMQVIRARSREVLMSPSLPLAYRLGLLEFMGFYPAQALLLIALITLHLVLPALAGGSGPGHSWATIGGSVILVALFAPTLAWSVREGRLKEWPLLAWSCALVYGGSLIPTARGVLDGLSKRERPWVPTNVATSRLNLPVTAWAEMLLGVALMAIPWFYNSPAVGSPASYLFIAVFLFSPLTFTSYRTPRRLAGRSHSTSLSRAAAGASVMTVLALPLVMLPTVATAGRADRPVETRGERLYVAGKPVMIRGIHYSPWLPGTGPHEPANYPSARTVDSDFARIDRLGANTVLLHEAPAWVVDRARERGFHVLYALSIAWSDTSHAAFEREADRVVASVESLPRHGGILAYILGNEVPAWVVEALGRTAIEERLRALASRVHAADPGCLVAHANWPPTKDLDLGFMDLVCFNLYPAWPYEVTVKGFGPYIRDVLEPIARGKPLLITEFGINSLEAGEARQAQVLRDCWREIASSRAIGGIVFSWADEWWKNYDNPIPGKGYWQRVYDPTDPKRHDADPEEYYGIVRSDRSPKPAYEAVRSMWRGTSPNRSPVPWVVLGMLGLATGFAFGLGRRPRRAPPVRPPHIVALWLGGVSIACCSFGSLAGVASAAWDFGDTLTGANASDQFGWALAGAGDLNGDSFGDVAVGAHFFTAGPDTAAGAVYVYLGGQPNGTPWLTRLEGLSPHEHFGESAAGDGKDIDGDGHADLAVGAPLRSSNGKSANGAVDVYRGGSGFGSSRWTTLTGEASNDWFGQSVALGDLDGDGKAEVIVGAPYNDRGGSAAGAVFVFRGDSIPPSAPWKVFVGEAVNDQFGWSVAYLGDVNGDGYGDFAVGARLHGTGLKGAAGEVYVFYGGASMDTLADARYAGELKDDWFGNSVAGPGDVDGGGRPDLLVGAPYNDRGGSAAGAAYLFRGEDPPGSPSAAIYVGESANAQFGWSASGAGDVNGDGRPDLLVGARLQASGALPAAGRVYVFPGGSLLSSSPVATADGGAADDWFGNAVGAGRGYFYPGHGAAIGGAPYNDASAPAAGRAYVLGMGIRVGVDEAPQEESPPVELRAMPNPAADQVLLRVRAPGAQFVARLQIFDIAGRLIRTLPIVLQSGQGSVRWDLRDAEGHLVRSGIFFIRSGRSTTTQRSARALRVIVLR